MGPEVGKLQPLLRRCEFVDNHLVQEVLAAEAVGNSVAGLVAQVFAAVHADDLHGNLPPQWCCAASVCNVHAHLAQVRQRHDLPEIRGCARLTSPEVGSDASRKREGCASVVVGEVITDIVSEGMGFVKPPAKH